ncbi:MAG: hypothetical protein OXG44_21185 [Gammaproteobacteria bacterium]|nr:hypothetical protein [Gammaproteobacteria bacterium]
MTINRKHFDKTERRPVSLETFEEAVSQILTSDQPEPRKTENREPTNEELKRRWRLDRRDGKPVA